MKSKAKFVKEIVITDPDSGGQVEIDIFKHEAGGMFGVDASYLDQCFDDDKDPVIRDPFVDADEGDNDISNIQLTGW